MAAAEMDLDAAGVMGGAAAPATKVEENKADVESRWLSTSSAESELDNLWHDSSALDHFYTTQDTVNTLDSFDFNDDNLFFGPFDSCSTGLSHHQTQDSARHMTEASAAGIESIDFASAQMPTDFSKGLDLDVSESTAAVTDPLDLSSWSLSLVGDGSSDSTLSLKDRLNSALIRGDGGRLFVPDDVLNSIMSPQSVSTELRRHFPIMPAAELQQLTARITAKPLQGGIISVGLLRMFAALVMSDKADRILDLLQEGLSDMALPLTKVNVAGGQELCRKEAPGVQLRCFKGWSKADLEKLEKLQWRVLTPIFSNIAKQQDVDFLNLEDQTVLPYVESWENKKHDHYKGGNSEVWKVKIHDAHHNFQNVNTIVPNNHYFAIKKLKSKDDEAFRREVRNLQRLHNAEHPNLLSLLATYKYKGYYHLVFPWADGDLRRLWQSTPNPQAGKEEMRWLASQCASIASALRSVHAGAECWMHDDKNCTTGSVRDGPSDKQRMAMNKFGIHGDIKPENIFIFAKGQQKSFKASLAMGPPNTTDDPSGTALASDSERSSRSGSPSSVADECIMSIGDFGGGEFFDASTNPDPLRQITVAYRPPEYDTKLRPVSRSWDVWGLGCTYLEFVTWFLLGPSGLTEFAKRRTTRTAAGKLSDEYFETFIDETQTGGVGATLKESVLAWINDLRRHKNSSQFIREFLDFITHRMFIVEDASLTRASGAEVADHLDNLTRRCFDSDDYCLPSPATSSSSIWDEESTYSTSTSLTALSDNFGLDFATAATEDVGGPSTWHFSSLDDVGALAQWNTAPILPSGSSSASYAGLNYTDMLGGWNYTAPVAWSYSNAESPSSRRKRKLDLSVEDLAATRRVSPRSSNPSPQTMSTSPTVDESPAAAAAAAESGKKKTTEKRFACPYYKNNPGKFRQKRTCCGPGWPTVHRVKEHLYRCHTIGKHTCSRCLKRCKSSVELLAHQRAEVSCDTRTDAFPEGTMLPCQEESLRVKKRVPPNTTEEQRWNEVYMVLFPDASADSLPTPFYENEAPPEAPARHPPEEQISQPQPSAYPSSAWFCTPSDYEEYLGRSLPARVQRELERQVQQEFGFFGDAAQTRRVVDMVQKMQLRLFQQFRQEREPGTATATGAGAEVAGVGGHGGGV